MLKNRNLSIAKLINDQKGGEYEVATVIASGNKTVDIKMLAGGIYRRVPVSGSASVGDQVKVLFLKGKPSVIAGGSIGSGATQIIINSGVAETPVGDYAPSPHDAFGSHHSWPTNATGQFLVTTSTAGSPAFRYIALSDIQSAADTRYALKSRIINAGNGLTGTGPLTADITLSVNPGNGIQISSGAVAIKLNATASGLFLNGDGLAVADSVAGSGIGISSKILSVAAATTWSDGAPASQGLQADADGLRIYASSAPGAAQHVLASHTNGRLTLPLFLATTSVSTPSLISGSGLSLTIASASDTILSPGGSGLVKLASGKSLQSDGYASQTTGMRITHSGEGDFRYIFTDELHAKSFIADLEQALAGGQIITKSVAVLFANYTLPAAQANSVFTVQDLPSAKGMRVFESGDFIGFRQFDRSGGGLLIGWAWGTVTNYLDNQDGTQSWTFTRSASPNAGIASGTINKDSIVLDFGENGNGYHEVNAIDGLSGSNSPYSQIVTWSGHPRTRTVRTRLGNLRGIFGASGSSTYSLVIQNATAGTFLIQIDDERTGAIAYNATAATVATAINSIIAGATVTLGISGTTYTYAITIPLTYSYLPFSVNGKNVTASDFICTLTNQTNSEFGLYAGKGTGVGDTYIRISDTTAEFRNTPIRLYDGANETMRLWAGSTSGSGNSAPSFAMGSPLPTGPVTNSTGAWMGLSGGSYQFRIGAANGTALTSGMHWTGSQLNIIGAIRLSGTTYATPTVSGLYADSAKLGYYNAGANQGGWRSWFDSSGNLTMRAEPVTSGTSATGIIFTSADGVLKGGYYTAAAGPAYGAFVTQWQTSATDGSILAANGKVQINSDGITVAPGTSYSDQNAYSFSTTGTDKSYMSVYNFGSSSSSMEIANKRAINSSLYINSETTTQAGGSAYISINAKGYTQMVGGGDYIEPGISITTSDVTFSTEAGIKIGSYVHIVGKLVGYANSGYSYYGEGTLNMGPSNISTGLTGSYGYSNVLEVQNTQLMRYKYGPSGFSDPNITPYLQYTVTSNTGGYPYGSFFINFAGRDGTSNVTQELWYFQVYRNYQGAYVWSSQRVAGTANVFARVITNTAGTSPNFTGTLTIRWWVGSTSLSYNDGLEITVSELSSGISAGHLGTFSVGSVSSTSFTTTPTTAEQGNTFAGTIIATDRVRSLGLLTAEGDDTGTASTISFSNVSNVATNSTGTGTIKFKSATSRDSTGFIKIYIGTTAYYVPVFSAIT